ncbi:MAG: protein translocase subunit SecF [Xanthomonadales bacterium]|nr:Protein translocase subunit SecF [Xanthomonadales bacterium]MCC6594217.1 protein translocase subunit SecF [Xanthomonadales bacterium]MCE7930616.1 protein translocase subunit SecF [Xanthomonadales bacterium PRO6]
MELFNPNANIPFMSWRRISIGISALLIVASLTLVFTRGFNLALDFTGGTLVEVQSEQVLDTGKVREALVAGGFGTVAVQSIGGAKEVAMRLPPEEGSKPGDQEQKATAERVRQALAAAGMEVKIKRSEFVGPQVGKELAEDGAVAVVFVLLTIMLYVAFRFEWRFGLSGIAGEVHDIIITLGFISLIGMEFDLTVLAALLTVAGYSINDKVVVFDRVREIFRSARKLGAEETINKAINNTLSRTLITGVTTFMALWSLYFLGGPVVENFALTTIFGIVIGTFSSIFFCNPFLLWLGVSKSDLQVVKKEDPALALRP